MHTSDKSEPNKKGVGGEQGVKLIPAGPQEASIEADSAIGASVAVGRSKARTRAHGGTRRGAGRPPKTGERMLYYRVSLPPSVADYIAQLGAATSSHDGNLSDGIRRLAAWYIEHARAAYPGGSTRTTQATPQPTTDTQAHDGTDSGTPA